MYFPTEIVNLIYIPRASYILEDILNNKYCINFKDLCKFLIKNNAVISESIIYECFDNTIVANDLDIFISNKTDFENGHPRPTFRRTSELEFVKLLGISNIQAVEKYQLQSPIERNNNGINYLVKYGLKNGSPIERNNNGINYLVKYGLKNGSQIDLVYVNDNVYNFIESKPFSTISNLYFNGKIFNIKSNNIDKLLEQKGLI